MPADAEFLVRHRGFIDADAGIQEESVQPTLGPGRTMAVLSRPLHAAHPIGWVICHSFGIEQVNLHRLEVVTARAMAAAGFPVLRFHVQGYGDSERRGVPVDVQWHLDGAGDAVALVRELDGVSRVGILGARFGAMVAALTAHRLDLDLIGLWQPYITGEQFLRDFIQTALFERMLGQVGEEGGSSPGFEERFGNEGWQDLNGFRLSRKALRDISAIDLQRDVGHLRGDALIVGVSRTGGLPMEAATLAAHLSSRGARCRTEGVQEKAAAMFGQHHFMKIGDGEVERDLFFDAFRSIAATTTAWAVDRAEERVPERPTR